MQRISILSEYIWSTVTVAAVSTIAFALYVTVPGLHHRALFTVLCLAAGTWAAGTDTTGFSTTNRMCLYGAAYGFLTTSMVVWV